MSCSPIIKYALNIDLHFFSALSFVAILIVCLLFVEIPYNTVLVNALQNSGHALIFAVISALLISFFRQINYCAELQFLQYCLVLVLSFCIGLFVELLQSKIGRDASWGDLYLDMVGAVSGLCLMCSPKIGLRLKVIYGVIGFVILLLSFANPLMWGYSTWARNQEFPLIGDFEDIWSQRFYQEKYGDNFDVVSAPPGWQSNAGLVGLVNFLPGRQWPGFENIEPYSDWSGFESLYFEIFSDEKTPFIINFRINDVLHNNDFHDRFNRRLTIEPGLNQFSFSLADIEMSPEHRQMDLTNIDNMSWFMGQVSHIFTVYIDNIVLR